MNWASRHSLCMYRLTWARRTILTMASEVNLMKVYLRSRTPNGISGGLRPGTLPLSHRGFPQYLHLIRVSGAEIFCFFEATTPPPCSNSFRHYYGKRRSHHSWNIWTLLIFLTQQWNNHILVINSRPSFAHKIPYVHSIFVEPFTHEAIQFKFPPTWSCVSLTRPTTSSGWQLITFV